MACRWDGEQAFYEGVVKGYDVKNEAYEVCAAPARCSYATILYVNSDSCSCLHV